MAILKAKKGIHIKPENKGKFNATKKKTGKSTEELKHSKNPLTRKRATFAANAKKWKHEDGGSLHAEIEKRGMLPPSSKVPKAQRGLLLGKKKTAPMPAAARPSQPQKSANPITPRKAPSKATFKVDMGNKRGKPARRKQEGGSIQRQSFDT
jgi:hypothetical protein